MDELVNKVCEETGLPEDEARTAVDTVVNYLKSKLPVQVAGQIDNALSGQGGNIADRLGGLFGKKTA